MSPVFEEILTEAGRDPKKPDVGGLPAGVLSRCSSDSLFGEALRNLSETVAAEPSEAFRQFVGHGPQVAGALLEEIEGLLAARGTTARRIALERGALIRLVSDAYNRGLISWRAETIPPPTTKRRVVAYLPDDTDARLRLEAARARTGLSHFVQGAIEEKLARMEQQNEEPKEASA